MGPVMTTRMKGFSLIELMVAVGVIGIISAIAVPMYTDYIETASRGVMANNMETIRLFQEDYKLSEGAYVSGTYDPASPNAAGGLKAKLGWEPGTTDDLITYQVPAASVSGTGYTVIATNGAGVVVTKVCSSGKCALQP